MTFWPRLIGIALLVIGAASGLRWPDVDQSIGFLLHRSIITHGPILPLLVFALSLGAKGGWRWFGMGICLGIAVHLAFDLFPRAWQGYALVSIPVYGRTPPVVSWVCIAGTMFWCVFLAVKLVREVSDGVALVVGLVGSFGIAWPGENKVWLPLTALLISLAAASVVAKAAPKDDRLAFR